MFLAKIPYTCMEQHCRWIWYHIQGFDTNPTDLIENVQCFTQFLLFLAVEQTWFHRKSFSAIGKLFTEHVVCDLADLEWKKTSWMRMGSTSLIAYFHFMFLHVLLHEAVASGYSAEQKDTRSTVSQKRALLWAHNISDSLILMRLTKLGQTLLLLALRYQSMSFWNICHLGLFQTWL